MYLLLPRYSTQIHEEFSQEQMPRKGFRSQSHIYGEEANSLGRQYQGQNF